MSLPPDIAEPTAPKDPAAYRPRALMGAGFWAMIAFGALCILAGVGVTLLGPRLLAGRPSQLTAAETAAPAPDAPVATSTPAAAPALAPPPPTVDVSGLSARVSALESGELRTAQAAGAALAAAAVVEASQGSGPFSEEIAGLRAIAPPSPELTALTRLAEVGAPSRAALSASFPDYAARAASAAHAPGDDAKLGDRIVYALSRVVILRRVGDVPGGAADAILARAERLAEDGDLDKALRTLDKLPAQSREALAPWRTRAERRAEIDRNAAALRTRALQALTAQSPRMGSGT